MQYLIGSILLMLTLSLHAQTSIIIKGQVTDYNNYPIAFAKIDLLQNNQLIKTITSDKTGNYNFVLDKGYHYTLVFHKYGYASKKIEVSTENITKEILRYGVPPIKFDVLLFEYFHDIDYSPLEKPVARYYYNLDEEEFVYDRNHFNLVKKETDKLFELVNQKKKIEYKKLISEAELLYNEKKYEDALLKYQEAQNLFRNEELPKVKIKELTEKLEQIAEIEKYYNINILKADKNFENKSYKISKSYYQKALIYKPNEVYPQNRIQEIENILAGNYHLINKKEEDVSTLLVAENKTSDSIDNIKLADASINIIEEKKSNISESATSAQNTIFNNNTVNENKQPFASQQKIHNAGLKPLMTNTNDTSDIASHYISTGLQLARQNDYDKAIDYFKKAYQHYTDLNRVADQAYVAEIIGELYNALYRYNAAADWFEQASIHYSQAGNFDKEHSTNLKSAESNYSSGNLSQALAKYTNSIKYLKNDYEKSNIYNTIGVIYYEMGEYQQALAYFNMSIKLSEKIKNWIEKGRSLNNIGNVKYSEQNYGEAIQYYNLSIDVKQTLDNKTGIAVSLFNIGNVYKKQNKYNKAIEYYKYAEKIALETNNTDVLYECYSNLAEMYSKTHNYEKAAQYYKLYANNKHLIIRKGTTEQISETEIYFQNLYNKTQETSSLLNELRKLRLLSYYEAINREKEINYLNQINRLNKQHILAKEQQVKTQQKIIYIIVVGIIIIFVLFVISLIQFYQKKKINLLLIKQNNEIHSQKIEIEHQRDQLAQQKNKIEQIHKELTDSIRYASRIQNAILYSFSNRLANNLKSFIIFKPIEDVSGDFYSFYEVDSNKFIVCVADCTGHGVPGAFMSILGISLLNEIIHKEKVTQPDMIENQLRVNLYKMLGFHYQEESKNIAHIRDGMDIAMIYIDLNTMQLAYSGANLPLYITRSYNGTAELIELKPDKMPIGYHEIEKQFTLKTMHLQQNDCIYLFSDGLISQFGGEKGKKFGYKNFKSLLIENHFYDVETQKKNIYQTLENWMKDQLQIDDITIVGIKI